MIVLTLGVTAGAEGQKQRVPPQAYRDSKSKTLQAACDAAVKARRPLLLTVAWSPPSNVSCGAAIYATEGGAVRPNAGVRVHVAGFAGTATRHFDLSAIGAAVEGFSGSPLVDPLWWGAACDARTVDNAAFQSAFETGVPVRVAPNRTCVLDSLEMPSGAKLEGSDRTSSLQPGPSGTLLLATGTPAAHKSGIVIRDLRFHGRGTDGTDAVFVANYADGVVFSGNVVDEISGIVFSPTMPYASVRPEWISSNVRIAGNRCYSSTQKGFCAALRYVSNVQVSGNVSEGYQFPFYWWGGDANGDGARANIRWAKDIAFTGNRVLHAETGIWGSMGERITVSGNTVERLGDVGYDSEGSNEVTFADNTCGEAVNGCMAAFFQNRGIRFLKNTVTQAAASHPMFRLYNNTLQPTNRDIALVGNTLRCLDPAGNCRADNAAGPSYLAIFEDNELTDTYIDLGMAVNQGNVQVTGNRLNFTHVLTGPAAIRIACFGASRGQVENNRIASTVPQTVPAILAADRDPNNDNSYRIAGNSILDFIGAAIHVNASAENAARRPAFEVEKNQFGRGTFLRTDTGKSVSTVRLSGNYPESVR